MDFTKFAFSLLVLFVCLGCQDDDDVFAPIDTTVDCADETSVFTITLTTDGCTTDAAAALNTPSLYEVTDQGTTSQIRINSIPSHLIGRFPNSGNPNAVAVQNTTYTVPNSPTVADDATYGQGWIGGVLSSGVAIETFTAEYFVGSTGVTNTDWNITTFQSTRSLGLDCNNAHVNPRGSYHYHGIPNAFGAELSANGSAMLKVGVAADGFPIYYKYIAEGSGDIVVATASYRLKQEPRSGDGITAPEGCHDGFYVQDYEFVEGIGDLDACNGYFGPTPDNPGGEYFYVLTETYPSAPICFSGTPDNSFRLR
ncbi:MAG: YHYH protein, partial [Bacteroidota bacterium]